MFKVVLNHCVQGSNGFETLKSTSFNANCATSIFIEVQQTKVHLIFVDFYSSPWVAIYTYNFGQNNEYLVSQADRSGVQCNR